MSQSTMSFVVGPPYCSLTCPHTKLSKSLETLESDGPFEPSFLANMVMVYNVLHACWGKLSWWSHVKKFSKTKNGQQVYRTLHTLLLG